MWEENVEVVRQPIRIRASSRRRMQERVLLGSPWVAERIMRAVLRRSPRSRVRRAMLRHFLRLAMEAANRQDYEAAFAAIPADYETIAPPELVGMGFDPVYYGRDGRLRMQLTWVGELGEFQQEADEVLDLGDRILLLGRMRFTGRSSELAFDSEVAYVLTVVDDQVVREQDFRSHAEALEAVGLRE